MLSTIPAQIEFDSNHLTIHWKDGRECSYDLLKLRKSCPCAVCRGGHGNVENRITGDIKEIQMSSYKKVGRYALKIVWSDHHDTGMYTYDDLREICEKS